MEIKKAVRTSVNLIMSVSGVSGSGKTYSALLLAAGLAGPGGKVIMIDTENGRGKMYADAPGIVAALPQGYDYMELTPPFSPARYIQALDVAERAGFKVAVIDSGSHEWEGIGGCSDIAETHKKRWAEAKKQNKYYVLRLLNSSMHVIICLRAREKTTVIPANKSKSGREEYESKGILPVAEKNFVFEMMCSWMVEETSHLAVPVKLPEQFQGLFTQAKLLTKADGDAIRLWNEGGKAEDPLEKVKRQSRAAAGCGMEAYKAFFLGLSAEHQHALKGTIHEENKAAADEADIALAAATEKSEAA
jgi:hypothetical protein